MIVFEGMTDMLSFLQLQKLSGNENNRTLVSLNSITNVDRFLAVHKDFNGKIFLCLDGDRGGDLATNKILQSFTQKNIKDVRPLYSISENGNNDLNDYLIKKINLQKQPINTIENGKDRIDSGEISDSQQNESGRFTTNSSESSSEIESEQKSVVSKRFDVDSNDVGDGSSKREGKDLGAEEERKSTDLREESRNAEERNSLGRRLLEKSTNILELDKLIAQYNGEKLTNEQVEEVVSAACSVSDDKKVILKENLLITDELKSIVNQFKSGGITKEGRGILDEYYTDSKIVDAIYNLIKDSFKDIRTLKVLEPSIGTGNFLNLVKQLDSKNLITAFEINETTAKIAKIFNPEADINLRSFESEFIDENGFKVKAGDYKNQYDLVIGNPPYGEHRGFYKGLGEEPTIAKYEDYFVKRSLDVLKDGGTLAMVLPSGWLNRQKKLENAELENAYRLPVGVFAGTQIGTDIIILKKSENKITQDISDFFVKNPENILGEIREKTNQYGRFEKYVHGTIEDALVQIQQLQEDKTNQRIGNLFDGLWNSKDKAEQEDRQQEKSKELKVEADEISNSEIEEKIETVISSLEAVNFKSPAVNREISKYLKYQQQVKNNVKAINQQVRQEIVKKAEKLIQKNKETHFEL